MNQAKIKVLEACVDADYKMSHNLAVAYNLVSKSAGGEGYDLGSDYPPPAPIGM